MKTKWTPEKTEQLIKLYNEGYPESFIASWLKIEAPRVRQRLAELGLGNATRRTRRSGMPELPSLHELYRRAASGWSTR
jgi:hypothetical protein